MCLCFWRVELIFLDGVLMFVEGRSKGRNLWRVELIFLEGRADISGGVCLCLWRVELVFLEGRADISGG